MFLLVSMFHPPCVAWLRRLHGRRVIGVDNSNKIFDSDHLVE